MQIEFSKYQGLGTDYILLDNKNGRYDNLSPMLVSRLCDRRFGVGAQGVIRLNPSNQNKYLDVDVFNSLGVKADFNGICAACVKVFANELGLNTILSRVCVNDQTIDVEVLSKHENCFFVKLKLDQPLRIDRTFHYFELEYGQTYCFVRADDIEKVKTEKQKQIQYSKRYPNGANLTFFQVENEALFVRHYERAAYTESYSNGISAVGAALIYSLNQVENPVLVKTKGGDIQVFFKKQDELFKDIQWQFIVNKVYHGQFNL